MKLCSHKITFLLHFLNIFEQHPTMTTNAAMYCSSITITVNWYTPLEQSIQLSSEGWVESGAESETIIHCVPPVPEPSVTKVVLSLMTSSIGCAYMLQAEVVRYLAIESLKTQFEPMSSQMRRTNATQSHILSVRYVESLSLCFMINQRTP